MERFVRFIITGGITLLAGLWLIESFDRAATLWIVGVLFVVFGIGGITAGIRNGLLTDR